MPCEHHCLSCQIAAVIQAVHDEADRTRALIIEENKLTRAALAALKTEQETLVAAIDDLTAAVTAMADVDAKETDAINKAVAVIQNPNSTDPQVEAAANAILASNKARSDATAALVAALPPSTSKRP